jgi:hypothetical protein
VIPEIVAEHFNLFDVAARRFAFPMTLEEEATRNPLPRCFTGDRTPGHGGLVLPLVAPRPEIPLESLDLRTSWLILSERNPLPLSLNLLIQADARTRHFVIVVRAVLAKGMATGRRLSRLS